MHDKSICDNCDESFIWCLCDDEDLNHNHL